MSKIQQIAMGLSYISTKSDASVSVASNDTVFVGHSEEINADEKNIMEGFGWRWDDDYMCWAIFT